MFYQYLLIALIAFFCESIDSSLGMGYGTILTPVLLFLGFDPLEVVPLVLFSEFLTGISSALMHHRRGNVNLSKGSRELKVAVILAGCGIFGTISAAFLALNVFSTTFIKGYIAILLLIIGTGTFLTTRHRQIFSWKKIFILGTIASFNKGLSGGGYGPLVTGGQILAGLKGKNAIGITSLAEGLTCLIGVIAYSLLNSSQINWYLGIAILTGALLSIPISVNIVKILKEKTIKRIISISLLTLGIVTLYQTFNLWQNFTGIMISILIILIIIIFLWQTGRAKKSINSVQEN